MITLLDNTVVSNFAVVERPDLLPIAFGKDLATPRQAFDELIAGVQRGKLPDLDWSWLAVWTLEPAETAHYQPFLSELNAGEAACLTIALHRGCRVLTDDRDAREFAHRLQIPLSGTLGVLVRLVTIQTLTLEEADVLLSRMIASGYRSPVTFLQALVERPSLGLYLGLYSDAGQPSIAQADLSGPRHWQRPLAPRPAPNLFVIHL